MTEPTHTWKILGVSRFTPAPGAPSYISSINWTLTTELGEHSTYFTSFTTFGPDHPGSADLTHDELIALIRDPALERSHEIGLGGARTYAAPFPIPEPQTPEIPVDEGTLISNEALFADEPPTPVTPPSKRRRARTKKGTYKGDDPGTPENEAWEWDAAQ